MAGVELRCPNKILHGVLGPGWIEQKCRSARCGAKPGVVVIHRFDTASGDLLETKLYKDPTNREGGQDGSVGHRASVRSA